MNTIINPDHTISIVNNKSYLARLVSRLVGTTNETMVVVGDSTGNETTEWVYLFLSKLLGRIPVSTYVSYRLYDDAVGQYGVKTVMQTGSGEPYVTIGADKRGWGSPLVNAGTEGQDLDIKIECALDIWDTTSEQVLAARYGAAGARSFRFYVSSTGKLNLETSIDGTTLVLKTSTVALGFAAGSRNWIRVTLDGDNGAVGYDIKFWTSTDGVTWTQNGTTITTAIAITLFTPVNQTLEIGARASTSGNDTAGTTNGAIGTFYNASISSTIDGPNRLPANIRDLVAANAMNGVRGGGPCLNVYNGSISGSKMTDTGDATRNPKMVPICYSAFVFLSSSHNEGSTYLPNKFMIDLNALVVLINARIQNPIYTICNQNPEYSPKAADAILSHAMRNSLIGDIAKNKNWNFIDVSAAFGTNSALVSDSDGIHPLAEGSRVWANEAFSSFNN